MIDTTSHFPSLIPKKNIKSLGYTIVLIPDYLRGEKWEQNNSPLYSPKEEFLLQCKHNIYNRQWHTTTSLRLLNVHATASIVVVTVAVIRIHLGHLPAHTLHICSCTTNTLGTPPHFPLFYTTTAIGLQRISIWCYTIIIIIAGVSQFSATSFPRRQLPPSVFVHHLPVVPPFMFRDDNTTKPIKCKKLCMLNSSLPSIEPCLTLLMAAWPHSSPFINWNICGTMPSINFAQFHWTTTLLVSLFPATLLFLYIWQPWTCLSKDFFPYPFPFE